MKTSTLIRTNVGFAVAALLVTMAVAAQDNFDKAVLPASVPRAVPVEPQVSARPDCAPGRADRWGGCRGKDYNGPIGDWGDPEYDERHRRMLEAQAGRAAR